MREPLSVVIATTCDARRSAVLRRALTSIRDQERVRAEIIIVANGDRIDGRLIRYLERQHDVRLLFQREGNLPMAIARGRAAVATAFFSYLDDDDEYLPHTLRARLDPLLEDRTIDAVVSPGYVLDSGVESLTTWSAVDARRDPLLALLTTNWLASCGGLFRSVTVGTEYFTGLSAYFEWTSLAFRLARDRRRIVFLDAPAFRIYSSPRSLSKSAGAHDAEISLLEGMLASAGPAPVRDLLRERLSSSYHCRAEQFRARGLLVPAWRCHLKSLLLPRGSRYVLYTRKLLFPTAVRRDGSRDLSS